MNRTYPTISSNVLSSQRTPIAVDLASGGMGSEEDSRRWTEVTRSKVLEGGSARHRRGGYSTRTAIYQCIALHLIARVREPTSPP